LREGQAAVELPNAVSPVAVSALGVGAVVVVALVLVGAAALALHSLARGRADELAEADVVRHLRPDGNAHKIEADE
jgi:hypothetical protein